MSTADERLGLTFLQPSTPAQWREARRLIEAYAASLGVDLSFQNFAEEIEHLFTSTHRAG